MLTDTLISQLRTRFTGRPFVVGSSPGPVATFPAAHPDVGDLLIHDDGDEFTVYLGRFTHVHFNCYDEALTQEERSAQIVDSLLRFLDDIFADRMEFFGSHGGGGGCRMRDAQQRGGLSKFFLGAQTYVWSGPVPNAR
jgi:hypothetical protein